MGILDGSSEDLTARLGLDASAFERGLGNVSAQLGGVQGLLRTAGIAAAAAFAGKAVMEAVGYEQSLILVRNRARETIPNLDALRGSVTQLSRETLDGAFAQSQVAAALSEVISEADTVAEALELMGVAGKLAVVAGHDLTDTAQGLADVLTPFNLKISDAARVADVLGAASIETNTRLGVLSNGLAEVGTQASGLGMSIEDAAVLVGVLKDKGVDSAKSLINAWRDMSTGGNKARETLLGIGIDARNADGSFRPLIEVVNEFNQRTTQMGWTQEQASALLTVAFGKSGAAVMALANDTERVNAILAIVAASQGAVEQKFKDSVPAISQARSEFNSLTTDLGNAFLPAVNEALAALLDLQRDLGPHIVTASSIFVVAMGRINASLDSLSDKAIGAGKDVSIGFMQGLLSGSDYSNRAMAQYAEDFVNVAKFVLGVESPSTVFAEIGRHTMAGLGLGLQQGSSVPQAALHDALGRMVTQAGGMRASFYNAGVLAAKGMLSGVQIGLVATGEAVVDAFGNIVFDRNRIQSTLAFAVKAYEQEIKNIASGGISTNFDGIFFNPEAIANVLQSGRSGQGVSGAGMFTNEPGSDQRRQVLELLQPVMDLAQRIASRAEEIKAAIMPNTNTEGIFFSPAAIARALLENTPGNVSVEGASLWTGNNNNRRTIMDIIGAREVDGKVIVIQPGAIQVTGAQADTLFRELQRLGISG